MKTSLDNTCATRPWKKSSSSSHPKTRRWKTQRQTSKKSSSYRLQEETKKMKTCFESQMKEMEDSLRKISQERDDLREMMNTHNEEASVLYLEMFELEKRNGESLVEVGLLRKERDGLLEEKRDSEKRFETMVEDSASIVTSLLVVQTDLEERLERRKRYGHMFLERALKMVKDTQKFVRRWEDEEDDEEERKGEEGEDGSEGEEMIKSFVVQLQAIRCTFWRQEEMMKDLKRKIVVLEGSAGDKGKKVRL